MQQYIENAKEVIQTEIDGLKVLVNHLDNSFINACEIMLNCKGRVVVAGMGKSGHIGKKISASLASTGTPSFFMHPAEAAHGDFGMLTDMDIILSISNSGNAEEIVKLIPLIKRLGVKHIVMTSNLKSQIAKSADCVLNISIPKEACPHGLAPTTSTTATLVMGDALTVSLLKARGFTQEDFAFSHPAGTLGKRLLLSVKDLMYTGKDIPKILSSASFGEAIIEMTSKKLGMTVILDNNNELAGIFTDGDLRRIFQHENLDRSNPINKIMSKKPLTIKPTDLAVNALNIMEDKKITCLIVSNNGKDVEGVIHMHDLLKSGII
jgi:arabinose-5-phosphate isomerase